MARTSIFVALLLLAWDAGATECQVKGFEFLGAAKDNMWPVISVRTVQGAGGCNVVNDSLVSAGAKDGGGVTCEATFFRGASVKGPWQIGKIKFGGATVELAPAPRFPTQNAQVTVVTTADAATATSLTIEHVVLVSTTTNCKHWRSAFKEE